MLFPILIGCYIFMFFKLSTEVFYISISASITDFLDTMGGSAEKYLGMLDPTLDYFINARNVCEGLVLFLQGSHT